ncbi:hypothetical protein KIS1582_3934 [Cytobacillus firmus]|uniref:Uncharacterized protein n=1 Tax=Cytobacillus firmus TaxID=1399 RepID=A0A800MTN4_CYTFI|nr:hypothetical protein KIS1582_3934 [Cytobacillus firmus]
MIPSCIMIWKLTYSNKIVSRSMNENASKKQFLYKYDKIIM